jgi:chorismate-pyruvate lyase
MGFIEQLNGLEFGSLDLLQRVLLISDGTLTDIVEAAFLEPIELVKIGAAVYTAGSPIEALALEAGSSVMRREILLKGGRSRATYVHAESLVALDAVEPDFREELLNSTRPMGRLWVQHRLETRKEILKVWLRPAAELAEHFGDGAASGLLASRGDARSW